MRRKWNRPLAALLTGLWVSGLTLLGLCGRLGDVLAYDIVHVPVEMSFWSVFRQHFVHLKL